MLRPVDRCRSQCRWMARDFDVAQPQRWELFSWNGPRKQGFLFAIENSRREVRMLMFQRRTVIGQLIPPGRIFSSINPPPLGLVAQKFANRTLPLPRHPKRSGIFGWQD